MSEQAIFSEFDVVPQRRGTGSLKWDLYQEPDAIPMWVADMDFAAPPPVRAALADAVHRGQFGYVMPTPSQVEAVVEHYRDRQDWDIQPDWIVWVPGLVSALNVACRAVGAPGDGVITHLPVYGPFVDAPRLAKRELVTIHTHLVDGRWQLDPAEFEAALTPATRLFLLCHPHNPVGRDYSREELAALAEICLRHRLVVCCDEIHSDLVLDGRRHRPFAAACPELAMQTITLHAASKTYNLAGLACAFAIIPDPELRRSFRHAMQGIVPEVNALGYVATEAAFRQAEPWRQELLAYLAGNRDALETAVRERLAPLRTTHVEATYLAWLDVRELGLDDPVGHFRQHGVIVSDGRIFRGSGYVRINFGCPRSLLTEGLSRLEAAVRAVR